jgi:SPP1 gp7 family putative phage head morphogenesis protein
MGTKRPNTELKKITNFVQATIQRTSLEIKTFRDALKMAENKQAPYRHRLLNIYHDLEMDTHFSAVWDQRKARSLNKPAMIVGSKDGKEIRDKTGQLNAPWFRDALDAFLESKKWGFSLMKLKDTSIGAYGYQFDGIELIDRFNVVPERGIITSFPGTLTGTSYRNELYKDWIIQAGKDCDLGILAKAAPFIIWKRNALTAYADYLELFGQPIRVGRTDVRDEFMRGNMENMLSNMGRKAWGVFDTEDILEMVESKNSGQGGKVFEDFARYCDEQISKLVLGGTMTVDSMGGNYKGDIHDSNADEITDNDRKDLEAFVNFELIPRMNNLGFDFKGVYWRYDYNEYLSLKDKWEIDKGILESGRFKIPAHYIIEQYGTPVEEIEPNSNFIEEEPAGGAGIKKPLTSITDVYSYSCSICGSPRDVINSGDRFLTDPEIETIINGIRSGSIDPVKLPKWYYDKIKAKLEAGLVDGFGIDTAYLPADHRMLDELKQSIYVFSGAKTHNFIKEASSLLLTDSGTVTSFSAFKERILKLDNTYNVNYLNAEYGHAVGSGRMAARWAEIERDGLPRLIYRTIGDSVVRQEHRLLNGICRPKGDRFWRVYYPPNGWHCRCDVDQVEANEPLTAMKNAQLPVLPETFKMNAGLDKYVFSPDHPYFKIEPKHTDAAMRNFDLDNNEQ